MPATPLKIDLPAPLAEDLRAAASACELTVEDFVRKVLEREAAQAAEALGWNRSIEDDLAALKDYEETGMAIPWEEVKPWLESLATDDPLPRPKARKLR
jgi:hypothetical protein